MSSPRRWLFAAILITAVGTVAATLRDGTVASRWTDALGLLLGGLAGTEIGERLERFGKRFEATWIAWLQMAAIAFLFVGVVTWQALPAYCQLPVAFAMGAAIVAAIVYIQRLRTRLG
jgi:hypothetical protein